MVDEDIVNLVKDLPDITLGVVGESDPGPLAERHRNVAVEGPPLRAGEQLAFEYDLCTR